MNMNKGIRIFSPLKDGNARMLVDKWTQGFDS